MKTYEEKTKKFTEQIIALCRECDVNSEEFAHTIESAINAAVIFGYRAGIKYKTINENNH
jgi:hypothetical protein